jgi:hypothetical protein
MLAGCSDFEDEVVAWNKYNIHTNVIAYGSILLIDNIENPPLKWYE